MSRPLSHHTSACGPDCCCCSETSTLDKWKSEGNVTGYKRIHAEKGLIFKGTIIHSISHNELEIIENGILGVLVRDQHHDEEYTEKPSVLDKYNFWKNVDDTPSTGIISFVVKAEKDIPKDPLWTNAKVMDLDRRFLIPGFIDTHTHAPQYRFAGCGRIPLLQWLEKYTFPTEDKFKNLDFAKKAYPQAVLRHVQSGTTTCAYYATINTPASLVLCDAVKKLGQRAFIGKVCMDRNSPKYYVETTEESLEDSELYVQEVLRRDNHLIQPIVTPRFVPSCSSMLMKGLAEQAKKYDINIQSHLSENKEEIAWVRSLHPEASSYTDVYDRHGLLTKKTIMAHCVHLSEDEMDTLKARQTGVAHCPNSNFSLHSGVMDARALLNKGIKVGLGTDVAGGYSVSMLNAIRQTIIASATKAFNKADVQTAGHEKASTEENDQDENSEEEDEITKRNGGAINYREAFYMATQGGAEVLDIDNKVGNFLVGKEFDALVINPFVPDSPFDVYDTDDISDIFQKFLFCGDDRNIVEVYVSGDCILKVMDLMIKIIMCFVL